jgi:hypothetical protein
MILTVIIFINLYTRQDLKLLNIAESDHRAEIFLVDRACPATVGALRLSCILNMVILEIAIHIPSTFEENKLKGKALAGYFCLTCHRAMRRRS